MDYRMHRSESRWLATPMYWFIMDPYKSPPFGSGIAPSTFQMVYWFRNPLTQARNYI